MGRTLKIIAIVVLVALLGGVGYIYKTKNDALTAELTKVAEEQKKLEKELDEIDEEIETYRSSINNSREAGGIVPAFECSTSADVDYALALGEALGFTPEIVVDCSMEDAALGELITNLRGRNLEVMLTASTFSMEKINSVGDRLLATETATDEYGFEVQKAPPVQISGVFLLREDNAENSKALASRFVGYTTMGENAQDGVDADSMVYLPYIYNEGGAFSSEDVRYAEALENKSLMLFCIKAAGVVAGGERDLAIRSTLDIVCAPVKDGKAQLYNAADAVGEIRALAEKIAANDSALAAYLEEKENEKEKIEEEIKSISNIG